MSSPDGFCGHIHQKPQLDDLWERADSELFLKYLLFVSPVKAAFATVVGGAGHSYSNPQYLAAGAKGNKYVMFPERQSGANFTVHSATIGGNNNHLFPSNKDTRVLYCLWLKECTVIMEFTLKVLGSKLTGG